MAELKIEYIPIDELTPYEKNARKHEDYDVDVIAQSIERYGFDDPVGVWGSHNTIVEGHGRVMAAKKIGMSEVPCIRLDHLTDEERKEYALIHNKSAELSTWDFDMLASELEGLDFGDIKLDWGLVPDEVSEDDIVEDTPPSIGDTEPICKEGDLWQLGDHRLICGDSTDLQVVQTLTGGVRSIV